MNKRHGKSLINWYQKNKAPHPWRVMWEQTNDPYVVWVSEIMLQQTQIKTVTPKYIQFMNDFPDVKALSVASEEQLRNAISGLGYYRRFRMMRQAAEYILSNLKGVFPKTYHDLLELPGVGVYTASAISSICFNEPYPVIDGNVERVLCRLFDIRKPVNDPKLKKEYPTLVEGFFDSKNSGDFNQAMMELGQKLCRPSSPNCEECVFSLACVSNKNSSQSVSPGPKLKKSFQEVFCEVEVLKCGDKFGLVHRDNDSSFLKETLGFKNKRVSKLPDSKKQLFKHTITNHKITGYVAVKITRKKSGVRWCDVEELEGLLHTRFDQKVFMILMSLM